jgi:starvation-inducible DNA-binding protein
MTEERMSSPVESLKVALADTFAVYLKAHQYHVNVEGPHFVPLHDLFGEVYSELWASIDVIAEVIRTLDSYVPMSPSRLAQLTIISEEAGFPDAWRCATLLGEDLVILHRAMKNAYEALEAAGLQGASNVIQDRLTAIEKHQWKLRSTLKR